MSVRKAGSPHESFPGTLKVVVIGSVRRKRVVGFGPFKRSKWTTEDYRWELGRDGDQIDVEDVRIERNDTDHSIEVNAKVKGIRCYLTRFDLDGGNRSTVFSFGSVAGIHITGTAELIGDEPPAEG